MRVGVGTAAYPDAMLEVRNNASAAPGTLIDGTVAHLVGANSANTSRLPGGLRERLGGNGLRSNGL